ncbi:MAG: sigma-70 family RNA polymerase sigma factor [Planctomycetota bacterium]
MPPDVAESTLTNDIADIVDRYQSRLLAYAYRRLSDLHVAQDAVQETFLRLCRHLLETNSPMSDERLAAWLFTVCRSRIIDMQRKMSPEDSEAIAVIAVDHSPPPDKQLSGQEDRDQLASCIAQLTARQQEVLQLRLQAGLSYQQIADVTGLSKSNVGFHLHAAMTALRQQLAPEKA